MKSNDNGGLFPETGDYANYAKASKGGVPEKYDNRTEEFLDGEEEDEI